MAKKLKESGELKSPASKFGQMIGDAFANSVNATISEHIITAHPDYELLKADEGKSLVTLEKFGGAKLQMDTAIAAKSSQEPIALLESKWLKDARHHNDKGAWILQLREVKKNHATIRGLVAVLAGHWTDGVGVVLMSDADVKMIHVATDDEVYNTLQPHLDKFLGNSTFVLNTNEMRKSYPRPDELLQMMLFLQTIGKLDEVAKQWLLFTRETNGKQATGAERIKLAVDELLTPLPNNPQIKRFEVSLQMETGNTIYGEFDDYEKTLEFLQTYFQNPEEILKRIKPKGLK
jgi:hypothetical protein